MISARVELLNKLDTPCGFDVSPKAIEMLLGLFAEIDELGGRGNHFESRFTIPGTPGITEDSKAIFEVSKRQLD